jgi:predicted MPP superfamily phosphohydrolase
MNQVKKLTRRDFLKLLGVAALDLGVLTICIAGYGVFMEPNWFQLETIHLKLPRLPKGFSGIRVVQISDIHMGAWMNLDRFQRVADLIIAQEPDLLLISGDFLIGHDHAKISQQTVNDLTVGLSRLANSFPTFAVLGNHDYWTNAETIRRMLHSCGITDLTNTVFTLQRGDERLHLCGVDDVWEGHVRLEDVIAQLSDDSAAILMAHEPDFADTSSATGRFDLQLQPHTRRAGSASHFGSSGPAISGTEISQWALSGR